MLDQPPPIGGDEMLVSLVAVVICLGLSFLFAGSETAITSMGEHRVRKLLEQKIGPAAFFELWLRDHSTVLTVLLAGNTLVNILASSLVTSLTMGLERSKSLPSWLGDSIVTISIFILTLFVLVVGEIVPKTLAKTRPEWFLRPFWIIYGFHLMTRWLTGGLTWLSKALVSMLGVDANASGFLVTEEQIEDMVRIGSEEGSIDVSRGDLLRNVFDLWDTPIRAIMTPRTDMVGIPVEANAEQILEIVRENGYSRYPIFDGGPDHVIGLFYAKQLIEAEAEVRNGTFELRNHVREPIFVPESQKASSLLQTFRSNAVHVAVVVDEHGGTAGIISLEDILEELVGDIYDEFDEFVPTLETIGPERWRVDASADMRDVATEVRIELGEEEQSFSTVGGYVLHHLGRMPIVGDSFSADGIEVEVLDVDAKKVLRVEIHRKPKPGSEGADAPASAA